VVVMHVCLCVWVGILYRLHAYVVCNRGILLYSPLSDDTKGKIGECVVV